MQTCKRLFGHHGLKLIDRFALFFEKRYHLHDPKYHEAL